MSIYDSALVKVFDNEVVEVVLENQLATKLNMMDFAKVDSELSEKAGMTKVIRRYMGTGNVEDLEMTEGNTETIGVGFTTEKYTVGTTQGRYQYYDEQLMDDPDAILKMARFINEQMVNDMNTKAIIELGKTPYVVTGNVGFDLVADGIAEFPHEDTEDERVFLLVNRKDVALWRKALKDSLEYTEDFVRTGYIGTVCGVPMYMSDIVPSGRAFMATREAVTIFIKKGYEVERERIPNTRSNIVYARKVSLCALTNPDKAIQLIYGNGSPTSDVTFTYTTPAGGELEGGGTDKTVKVNAPSGPVSFTIKGTASQEMSALGANADKVSFGGTATEGEYTVSVSENSVFSVLVEESGKAPIVYNVTVIIN